MKHPLLIVLLIVLCFGSCKKDEQEPVLPTGFEKFYGNEKDDVGWEITQIDGLLYVIGTTETESNKKNIYLLKLKTNGDLVFQKNYGGAGNEGGYALQKTQDGNLLLVGSSESNSNGATDVLVIKVNLEGEIIWQKQFGGSKEDFGVDIIENNGSGYCVLANTKSKGAGDIDIWLIWIDNNGNLVQERTYGSTQMDGGSQLLMLDNNELLVYGYTRNFGAVGRDLYLLKTNLNGDSLWSRIYGGDGYEESQNMVITPEGDYLMVGHSSSIDPNHNMITLKTKSNGEVIWQKNYGGLLHDGGQALLINSNGNYVFVARSMSFGNKDRNAYVVTTNKEGQTLSELIIDAGKNDRIDDFIECSGYYFFLGRSNSNGAGGDDLFLVKKPI